MRVTNAFLMCCNVLKYGISVNLFIPPTLGAQFQASFSEELEGEEKTNREENQPGKAGRENSQNTNPERFRGLFRTIPEFHPEFHRNCHPSVYPSVTRLWTFPRHPHKSRLHLSTSHQRLAIWRPFGASTP